MVFQQYFQLFVWYQILQKSIGQQVEGKWWRVVWDSVVKGSHGVVFLVKFSPHYVLSSIHYLILQSDFRYSPQDLLGPCGQSTTPNYSLVSSLEILTF